MTYLQPISKLGHRLCQNNSIVFENCRVPEENLFAKGAGDLIISKAFTWSGPVPAIAADGSVPIIHHQAVGYLLADVAMKIEAPRAFSWKAAHYLDQYNSEGHAVGAMAKVFCGERLFHAVFKLMQAMGVNSLDRTHPIEKYLREAAVFPLYDAGNIGIQMRKIWGVMLDKDFDPRAIADSRPMPFKKSMEGAGLDVQFDLPASTIRQVKPTRPERAPSGRRARRTVSDGAPFRPRVPDTMTRPRASETSMAAARRVKPALIVLPSAKPRCAALRVDARIRQ